MSGDRVERSSKKPGKQKLLIAGFHRSKGHSAYPATMDGRFPRTGVWRNPNWSVAAIPSLRAHARVHLIALAAGIQKEPVRAMSI